VAGAAGRRRGAGSAAVGSAGRAAPGRDGRDTGVVARWPGDAAAGGMDGSVPAFGNASVAAAGGYLAAAGAVPAAAPRLAPTRTIVAWTE
jgi:hypothetical protein